MASERAAFDSVAEFVWQSVFYCFTSFIDHNTAGTYWLRLYLNARNNFIGEECHCPRYAVG